MTAVMLALVKSPRWTLDRTAPLVLAVALSISVLAACRQESPTSRTGVAVREVSVAAAADLKFVLDEISREFGKQNKDIRANVTFGSSGNFYSQLQNQAPFDLFLSADMEYPRKLAQQGLSLSGTEFSYAVGRLAVWVPASSPMDVRKLEINSLKNPSVRHISIANPQHAPYGRAAEAAMRSLGVYDAVKDKLVFGENVAQALQFVQTGNAEIGIVALSLAISPEVRDQGRNWEVPLDSYPRMEQGGVILKWAKDAEAARTFRAFLTSPEGRSIFKRYGFALPGE
jgi:molybdate transport system substrate-binding protein